MPVAAVPNLSLHATHDLRKLMDGQQQLEQLPSSPERFLQGTEKQLRDSEAQHQ